MSQLPEVSTSFVGREAELAAVLQMLGRPECRLVTLIAPGGSGKTRLAVEVAAQVARQSGLPVYFVNLEPHGDGDGAALAIGDAFGLTLPRIDRDGDTVLAEALREKSALLVLDNFEHLVDTCAGAVGRIAANCPELRILVTSRVALNIQQEWRFSLEGLPFETTRPGDEPTAVRLFIERARRVSGRGPDDFDLDAVRRVCAAVEGMPLAIEMAAAWARSMSEAEIAQEITGRLDILTATMRDLPARQRSIAAVFDQSLDLLDQGHRRTFLHLGVFESSFGRGAAVEVAGASLPVLATLVDHSLVWAMPGGRYRLHSLLRNYARSALAESGDLEDLQQRHSSYYLEMVAHRFDDILGKGQYEAITGLAHEYDNLAHAWRFAIETRATDLLCASAVPYSMFLDATARYQEGLGMADDLVRLARSLPEPRRDAEAAGLVLRAGTHIRLGNLAASEADNRAAHELRMAGVPIPGGVATNELAMLGLVELVRGNYAAAETFADRGHELAGDDDAMGRSLGLYVKSGARFGTGDYAGARRAAEEALELTESCGEIWFAAYIRLQLAECGIQQKLLADALEHAETARASRERFGDRQGVALATLRLGDIAFRQAQHDLARQHYLNALALYRETADRGGRATVIASLAEVDAAAGDIVSARRRFLQALELAETIGYASALAQVFLGVATVQARASDTEGAAVVLAYLKDSTSVPRGFRDQAETIFNDLQLAAPLARAAERRASSLGMEGICGIVKSALHQSRPVPEQRDSAWLAGNGPGELTQREVQVLALLDRGGTNSSVAQELGLTTNTVKWYCTQIFAKLGAPNRTAALARARELGLLA